ncbi:MAG: hypothetical protein JO318_18370 [Chloroflexi bacterium]|nr:hypothetical protein [Chloroflexota bacterium]
MLLLIVLGVARGGVAGLISDGYRRVLQARRPEVAAEVTTESAITPSPV